MERWDFPRPPTFPRRAHHAQLPKVQEVAQQILDALQAGTVPAALAQIFIRHKNNSACPAARWSWRNQLTAALTGHYDARGFRQWQQVGRNVRKGERAFYILGPCMVKDKDAQQNDEEPAFRLVGFTAEPARLVLPWLVDRPAGCREPFDLGARVGP
jgi:hypothetical protein